jgi:HTH-type transcriptional regulator, competence development regulator
MTFGKTLERIRRAKGVTQREIATKIGMDFSYFSRLENDRHDSKPTRETIDKIAKALDCTDAERSDLLAAAGRGDEELEDATRRAATDQELGRLFRSVVKLSPGQRDKIMKKVESELKANAEPKPRGK